ncbi:hypothetical protein ACJJI4_14525 [Microbulbifer sp. TRSA002]|uniref:hypothetical protein n=1 Tax=Microbulbifer sp. TRSA002 TaxID=3243382 RepID=UPI00403A3B2F
MKYSKCIGLVLSIISTHLSAAEIIEVPNIFVSGEKAIAAEVNENFSYLVAESNDQNIRLNTLESLVALDYEDKMVCAVWHTWIYSGDAEECVQISDPTNVKNFTFAEVISNEWELISIGGGDRQAYIFGK